MSEEKKPDYIIEAHDTILNRKGPVGVGWSKSDGSISIRFNEFIQLQLHSNTVLNVIRSPR
jgi:hypothetical protein